MPRRHEDSISFHTDPDNRGWVRAADRLERCWAPQLALALQKANATPGEHVLDIGCGTGPSTVQLARAVGSDGRIVGVDISKPNLEVAQNRMITEGLSNVELIEADAQAHVPEGPFDLVFSSFGAMFFKKPIAAFANLRRVQRQGGRLIILCFQSLQRNPWTTIPREAMTSVVNLPPFDPTAPGRFSLGDSKRTQEILAQAGYRDIELTSDERLVDYAPSVEEALDLYQTASPLAVPLTNMPLDKKGEVLNAIRAALNREIGEGPVCLVAATWIMSAYTS